MQTGSTLKNITKVAGATFGSRVLGLVRDQITFAVLGVSAFSDAFFFAFNLPNLFRRLMGEGALTSAMIPVLAGTMEKSGEAAAFDFVNKVLSRTFILLLAFTLVGIAVCVLLANTLDEERYVLSSIFSALLLPYMILICLAAAVSGALNTLGVFGLPSMGPMLLNIAMISSLLLGRYVFGADLQKAVYVLCGGVIFGGALQLGLPVWCLRRRGWRWKFTLAPSPELSELIRIFIPALAGAAIIQINIFVGKILALYIDATAVSVLYLSSRLVELPLGIFAITIATVYFPKLSRLSHSGSLADFIAEYRRGLITTLAITIPATFGLIALSRDALSFLFEWGAFGAADVDLVTPVLIISVAGIPFYSVVTYATRGFHSGKDTKTPLKISAIAFTVNIVLSLILMWEFKAAGLAAANVAAAVAQSFMLSGCLKRSRGSSRSAFETFKVIAASLVMLACLIALKELTPSLFAGKTLALANCIILVPAGIAVYALTLKLSGFEQFKDLSNIFRRKK